MITVKKPTPAETEAMSSLPTWGCKVSTFDWTYSEKEICLLIRGRVRVTYDGGEVEFGAGDMVTFEKGLSCTWHVSEDVEKYYKFV
jgi:uncharacterized cupin superfamily protein